MNDTLESIHESPERFRQYIRERDEWLYGKREVLLNPEEEDDAETGTDV